MGVARSQLPDVVPMCAAGGRLPGSDTVFTGGSIDALCDQVVAGADDPGDVHVIFGATLIVWVVSDQWIQVPDLISYPHTTPTLPHRWPEQRRRAVRRLGAHLAAWRTSPRPWPRADGTPDR